MNEVIEFYDDDDEQEEVPAYSSKNIKKERHKLSTIKGYSRNAYVNNKKHKNKSSKVKELKEERWN